MRRYAIYAILAMLAALVPSVQGTAAASTVAGSGVVSGRLTATGPGALAGICVEAAPVGGGAAVTGITNHNGEYTLTVPAGSYTVSFDECAPVSDRFVGQYWPDASTVAGATVVTVVAAHAVANVNATLVQTGAISGRVVDVSGHPLDDVCVTVTSVGEFGLAGRATTGTTGYYAVSGLAPGDYAVDFATCQTTSPPLQSVYYPGNSYIFVSTNPGAVVVVQAGKTTSGIGVNLLVGGAIAGVVSSAVSGAGASGICVSASSADWPLGNGGMVTASSTGYYLMTGLLPGHYDLYFNECDGNGPLVGQWSGGVSSQAQATAVPVTNVHRSTFNQALPLGGAISGTVTSQAGVPLPDICVWPTPAGGPWIQSTSSTGYYRIGGLPQGSVQVEFSDCSGAGPYATQWYAGQPTAATAQPVPVEPGETTTGVDATMQLGGSISGSVTGPDGVVNGVLVTAFLPSGRPVATGVVSAGTYTLSNVPPGTYEVEFQSPRSFGNQPRYVTQWWKGASSQASATPVELSAGGSATGINATLVVQTAPA
jgi:hypothetical protein